MPNLLNKSGHFEPVHAAHAIEQVAFILQFHEPLTEEAFANVRTTAEQFREELPAKAEIRGVRFSFSPGMNNLGEQSTPVSNNGFVMQRMEPDGTVSSELRVEHSTLFFKTTRYLRWDSVWLQAKKYFSALTPIYAEAVKLSSISINCVDKFVWIGNPADCEPNQLLRAQSGYVSSHVHAADDFWHSHTGAFSRADAQTKRLINVNTDYLDEQVPTGLRRVVAITTVLTDLLNQPGYEEISVGREVVMGFIDTHMQSLHLLDKKILGDVINDNMSERIALKG